MDSPNFDEKKLIKAKKRVEEIKGFYKHVAIYLIVNLFLTFITHYFDVTIRIYQDLEISNKITESGFAHYPIWYIWGFFLLVDAIKVFIFPSILGKSWQNKKIEEYMNDKNIQE